MSKPASQQPMRSTTGLGVLIPRIGWISLPDSLAAVEQWRRGACSQASGDDTRSVMAGIASCMTEAIVTGRGAIHHRDLRHFVVMHWPGERHQVIDTRDMASALGTSERALLRHLDELCRAGIIRHCSDGDGGYESGLTPAEVIAGADPEAMTRHDTRHDTP